MMRLCVLSLASIFALAAFCEAQTTQAINKLVPVTLRVSVSLNASQPLCAFWHVYTMMPSKEQGNLACTVR